MAKNNKSSDKAPQVALPKKFTLYYVLIFVLAFIYYGNGIKNGYSLDDNLITSTYNSKHPTIEGGLAAIPEIFTTHFVVNSKQSYAYRPVATSSFAIEYQFFGTNPHVSHFFNILIYALEILVLFKLLNRLWGEDKYILTVLVSFLFLIHPIHSEVVNNIKCRDELLSFLFGMLAMYHAINYIDRQNKKYLIYISLFMLMSILSKPTGLIFIAVIPFTTYFFREITFKRILPIIGFIVIGYAFFKGFEKLLVDATVNRVKYYFENPLYYMGFAPRIPMFFYTNFYYIALLVFPYPLRYYYGYDQVPLADWSNPIVYLMILTTALGLYFMIKRFKNKDIWAYGIWFYLLGIGGALNLLSPMVGIVAERFVYIGSVGFCIAVGYAIYHYFIAENSKFRSYSKFMNVGVIAVGLVSFVYSFERNKVWDSEISLYQNDMKNLDRSYKAYTMLGQIYYTQGTKLTNVLGPTHPSVVTKIDSSESLLKESLKIYDEYPVTYNNLGVIYYTYRGNIDTAIKFFNRAVELDSVYLEAIYNLANSELWKLKSNLISFRAFSDLVTNGQISSSNVINPNKIVALSQITILSDQLERIRGYSFAIPSQAAQNVANDSIFFLNLRSYTLSMLKNNNLINYFSIEEFDSKMLQNKQEIIK